MAQYNQMIKGENLQTRILYLAKLSLIFEGEFYRQIKTERVSTTKLVLQETLKEQSKTRDSQKFYDVICRNKNLIALLETKSRESPKRKNKKTKMEIGKF